MCLDGFLGIFQASQGERLGRLQTSHSLNQRLRLRLRLGEGDIAAWDGRYGLEPSQGVPASQSRHVGLSTQLRYGFEQEQTDQETEGAAQPAPEWAFYYPGR